MSESAYKVFEIASTGQLKRIATNDTNLDPANNARQKFPKTYCANGYVDILSVEYIKKSGMLHGDNVIPFITPITLEIDTEKDFELIEREVDGVEARILQHEIDHLSGKLFVDYLSYLKRNIMIKKVQKYLKIKNNV